MATNRQTLKIMFQCMFNLTQATEKQANKDAKKVSFFFNNFFALPRATVVQNAVVLGTLNTC